MTDLRLFHHFLGMGVIQADTSIFIHQMKYVSSLLDKFGLKECKSVSIPLVATEKLSKDDGSASLLARYMHCPTNKHYGTAKRVLRYVKRTLDYGLKYEKGKKAVLVGFCDSD
ncbi:hypothetical protein PS2_003981 [Malus domestica]